MEKKKNQVMNSVQIMTNEEQVEMVNKEVAKEMLRLFKNEISQAIADLYFQDGEIEVVNGQYKIASWCEEGDWQYVIYYKTEAGEWESWEDCNNYFCYFDICTKETTSLKKITKDWILPFFEEDFKSCAYEYLESKEQED